MIYISKNTSIWMELIDVWMLKIYKQDKSTLLFDNEFKDNALH